MSTISEQEYQIRIAALERLNATLAAQVIVIDAVLVAFNRGGGFTQQLATACDDYITAMAQLAKESGDGSS